MKVHVSTPSRIHATLIDMNGSLGRIDGGVGFTLDAPGWNLVLEISDEGIDVIARDKSIETSLVNQSIIHVMRALGKDPSIHGIKATVNRGIPSHVGLGSHTQLALAMVDGISCLFNHALPRERNAFSSIVGRGGTSGIGVTAYFHGGAIIDGGHAFGPGKDKEAFAPSSASVASPAPVIMRVSLPRDWRVVCAIPALVKGAHDKQETNVFSTACPVPLREVERLCHLILMILMPAFKRHDFNEICDCINHFQDLGFKKVEVDIRGRSYREIMKTWRDKGAPCVGMSSFGPTMYALAPSDEAARELEHVIQDILGEALETSFITAVNSTGASIRVS